MQTARPVFIILFTTCTTSCYLHTTYTCYAAAHRGNPVL